MGKNVYGMISPLNIDLNIQNQLTFNGIKVGEIKTNKDGNITVRIDMNARKYYFNNCQCENYDKYLFIDLKSVTYFGNLEIKRGKKLSEYKVKFKYNCTSQYEIDSGVRKLKLLLQI